MAMYDNDNTVEKSFDLNYISDYLIQAQWSEFVELKKVIHALSKELGRPVSILDIGVGNARIPMHLCGIKEIWDQVAYYDGTDNAKACVDIAAENIAGKNIGGKVTVHLFEATSLDQWKKHYDMVICTWFTPGNFYPCDFSFDSYKAAGQVLDLTHNKKFETVFSGAYGLLNPGGLLVLGACYIDNNATRLKQEASYEKMGMHIITSSGDSFTATREGFWSQRFTIEKLYSYLSFVSRKHISIVPLDTYDYAMQVRIKKL